MTGAAAANLALRDELTIDREDFRHGQGSTEEQPREKKPKQEKVKTVAAVSAFTTPKSFGGKK